MKAHPHASCSPIVLVSAVVATLVLADPAHAQGRSCEQLRDEIATRIALPKDSYRLEIAAKDATGAGKTMGTCEMGARKIVFSNTAASEPVSTGTSPAPAPVTAAASPDLPPAAAVAQPPAVPVASNAVSDVASPAPQTRPAIRRGGPDEATWNQYKAWISEARAMHPYRDAEERMLRVMECESGGNAGIVSKNGLHHGLFQYMTATWKGAWNTYRDAHLTDARAQIFATALAWSTGMANQWGCYARAH